MSVETASRAATTPAVAVDDTAIAPRPNRTELSLGGRICKALTPSTRTCVGILVVAAAVGVFYKITNPNEQAFQERCDLFCMSKSIKYEGATFCNEMTNACYLLGKKLTSSDSMSNIISFEGKTCTAMRQAFQQVWTNFAARFGF
jgi:hypothetical protein